MGSLPPVWVLLFVFGGIFMVIRDWFYDVFGTAQLNPRTDGTMWDSKKKEWVHVR